MEVVAVAAFEWLWRSTWPSCFMCKISYPFYFAYVIPKYLRTTLTNENCIHEESKSRLGSGNACCHLVQNILSSSFLPKDIKIKIYRTPILRVVVCWCETWSVHWERNIGWVCLRIGCWGRYLYLRGARYQSNGGDCIMSFMICDHHQILFGC